jgi:hypothetical protein
VPASIKKGIKSMKNNKPGFVNTVNDASVTKVIRKDKDLQTEPLKVAKPKEKTKGASDNVDKA